MTMALCFACGGTKFGALVPCMKCHAPPHPDAVLNIAFSDHYMSVSTIKQFGAVIRKINSVVEDHNEGLAAFLQFVSTRHPDILDVSLSGEGAERIPDLLERLDLPTVEVTPGYRNPAPVERRSGRNSSEKKWWQFWRRRP